MKIERSKNAKRNIIFGGILKGYQMIIPFLMRTAMIHFIGVEYLGLNSLFTSILQVLNLAELGVGSAMVYSMYKPIVEDDKVTICALLRLYKVYYRVIGLVVALLGMALLPFLPKLIKSDIPSDINIYTLYLLNLAATVLSYWLFAYKNSLLNAHQRNDLTSKVNLFTSTIKYVLQFGVLYFLRDYYLYVIVILITQVITNIFTAVIATKMYPDYKPSGKLDVTVIKDINQRIKDLFTAKFGSVVVGSVDTIVISTFLGLTALAIYQNYYFIMNSVRGFISVFFSAVLAGIGNSLITDSKEKNYNDLKKFTFIICWIFCVCCCFFIGLYQPFMILWVGEDFLLPFDCVILFCIYFYVCELAMIWATVKDAAGIWHEDRYRPLLSAVANLLLNLLLVNYIGLQGILLSTILSYVFVAMPWLLRNLFKLVYKRSLVEYICKVVLYCVITIVSCIITHILCRYVNMSGIPELLVCIVISVIVPNILQVLVYGKSNEFRQSLDLIKRMIRK